MPFIYDLTDGVYHYIGQTTQSLRARRRQHISRYKRVIKGKEEDKSPRLTKGLTNSGPNLFKMVLLFECEEYELDSLETKTITEYRSQYGDLLLNGPSSRQFPASAGELNPNCRFSEMDLRYMRYELFGNQGLNPEEIAESWNSSVDYIQRIIYNHIRPDPEWEPQKFSKDPKDMWAPLIEKNIEQILKAKGRIFPLSKFLRKTFTEAEDPRFIRYVRQYLRDRERRFKDA